MEKSSNPLAALLRCPESGQPLRDACGDELAALRLLGHACPEGALVREDQRRAFPIRDGFPVLIASEALELG